VEEEPQVEEEPKMEEEPQMEEEPHVEEVSQGEQQSQEQESRYEEPQAEEVYHGEEPQEQLMETKDNNVEEAQDMDVSDTPPRVEVTNSPEKLEGEDEEVGHKSEEISNMREHNLQPEEDDEERLDTRVYNENIEPQLDNIEFNTNSLMDKPTQPLYTETYHQSTVTHNEIQKDVDSQQEPGQDKVFCKSIFI